MAGVDWLQFPKTKNCILTFFFFFFVGSWNEFLMNGK